MPLFKFAKSRTKKETIRRTQPKSKSMGVISDKEITSNPSERGAFQTYQQNQESRVRELVEENNALQQENNLLRLKVEVLLDMLAQKTAEAELFEADILKMKNILANS